MAEESLNQHLDKIYQAFRQVFPPAAVVSPNDVWICEVFEDHVIVDASGTYYKVSYLASGEDYVFSDRSEWVEVEKKVEWVAAGIQDAVRSAKRNPLKTLGKTDDTLRVGNYLALFGGRDLTGEFFTKSTQFESDYTRQNLLIEDFEHGYAEQEDGMGPTEHDLLGRVDWSTKRVDDYGLWVERLLDRRSKYLQYLEPLIEAGLVGTSSEADPNEVQVLKTGEITKWPLVRDTLTFSPAEPRMLTDNVVRAFKSLAIALPQEAKPEAVRSTAVSKPVAAKSQSGKTAKDKKMKYTKSEIKTLEAYAELNGVESWEDLSDEQREFALKAAIQPEPVDVESIVKRATEEAVKAAMEAAPAVNEEKGKNISVTRDEADIPFKNLAENARAVKEYALTKGHKVHPRLKFLFNEMKAALGGSEGIPSDGGILLDPTISPEVMKPVHETGPFSSLAKKLPVSSNSNSGWINGVDETSRATGSRWGGIRGYRLAEAGSLTSSKPTFRRINWELKKYGCLVYGTDELLQDAAQFSAVVNQGCQEELSFMLNDDIVNGDGLAGAEGIMNSGSLITVTRTTGSKILGEDISAMYNRMDLRGRKNAVWFIGNDSQPQLDNLFAVGSTAVLYPYASIGADGIQRLYGRPVVVTEFNQSLNTTGDILFADMDGYLMWEKSGVQAQSSIHVQFLTDEEVFRFIYRADGHPAMNSPLTPYLGSTTTSSFVVLGSAT